MPELPEVQTIVDDLNRKIAGRLIIDVWSDYPKAVKKPLFKHFKKIIKNKKILSVKRRAKNLFFYLSDDFLMAIHLKMTGHLLVGKWEVNKLKNKEIIIPLEPKDAVIDSYNQYIHFIFYLDDGRMVGFSDARKFGKIILGKKEQIENLPEFKNLGPEPLDKSFTVEKLKESLRQAQGKKIKQVLMDPEVIAGIGNIYSDEILWLAKINPFKPANKLSEGELRKLWKATRKILIKALKLRGTSISDYRDTSGKRGGYDKVRLVYRREKEKCFRCGVKIKRAKIGGRSAHFCPHCQKL